MKLEKVFTDIQQELINAVEKLPKPRRKKILKELSMEQGLENDSLLMQRICSQIALIILYALIFYNKLHVHYPKIPKITVDEIEKAKSPLSLFHKFFQSINSEILADLIKRSELMPISLSLRHYIQILLQESHFDPINFSDEKSIINLYGQILNHEDSHTWGQYYTPPEIVELITSFLINHPRERILDPACGSGAFLVGVYKRLRDLRIQTKLERSTPPISNQMYGIDIFQFPLYLAQLNVALSDIAHKINPFHMLRENFLRVGLKSGMTSQKKECPPQLKPKHTHKQKSYFTNVHNFNTNDSDDFNQFDVILGNPPYIRQELLDKSICRAHLSEKTVIDERSDIYIYFFTHAFNLLKEKGMLGYLIPEKWLTVGYGVGFQKFLLQHFRILAIITFDRRIFSKPFVSTCVTLLEKCTNANDRNQTSTKFMKIKQKISMEKILAILKENEHIQQKMDTKKIRLIIKPQIQLQKIEKWNRFLIAPDIYWKLLENPNICHLEDICSIQSGLKTGANDFFYITKEKNQKLQIHPRFLRPLAKSIRQINNLEFHSDDTELYLLDLHSYIQDKLSHQKTNLKSKSPIVKSQADISFPIHDLTPNEIFILDRLYQEGYTSIYQYIINAMVKQDWGRYGPPHTRETCRSNRSVSGCWFDLGAVSSPDLFFAKGCWNRVFTPLNCNGLVADQRIYQIFTPHSCLAGILNSVLYRFFREFHGRITGAGMSEYTVYEARKLPVLDPRVLTPSQKDKINHEFQKLRHQGTIQSLGLDLAVCIPLGFNETEVQKLNQWATKTSQMRRKGKHVDQLLK